MAILNFIKMWKGHGFFNTQLLNFKVTKKYIIFITWARFPKPRGNIAFHDFEVTVIYPQKSHSIYRPIYPLSSALSLQNRHPIFHDSAG